MHPAIRCTRSIRAAAAVVALLGVTACSRQATEPNEAEVWPPTALSSRYTDICSSDYIQRGQVIVDFKPGITAAQADSFAVSHGLSTIQPVPEGNSYLYRLADSTETSHEFAKRVRDTFPEMILWAETAQIHEHREYSTKEPLVYVTRTSLNVDMLSVHVKSNIADSLSTLLIERFSLIAIPKNRWTEYMFHIEMLWTHADSSIDQRFYEIDREVYGFNQFDANCLGALIYGTLEAEELAPDENQFRGGAVDRLLSSEYYTP